MIPAIVLAAGKSTRMGRPKASLPADAVNTFLSRIVRTFLDAGTDDVVVVVGHDADAIMTSFAASGLAARFVTNRDYELGQLSSLQTGMRLIDRPGVVAVMMTPVDVPLVSASTVQAVTDRYRATRAPIVRPVSIERADRHGHPVLIDRSLFPLIYAADHSVGAKPVVRAHVTPEGDVAVADEGAFLDIDTPDEYARVIGSTL